MALFYDSAGSVASRRPHIFSFADRWPIYGTTHTRAIKMNVDCTVRIHEWICSSPSRSSSDVEGWYWIFVSDMMMKLDGGGDVIVLQSEYLLMRCLLSLVLLIVVGGRLAEIQSHSWMQRKVRWRMNSHNLWAALFTVCCCYWPAAVVNCGAIGVISWCIFNVKAFFYYSSFLAETHLFWVFEGKPTLKI